MQQFIPHGLVSAAALNDNSGPTLSPQQHLRDNVAPQTSSRGPREPILKEVLD